ncbi:hypothetical protein CP8484711_0936A, partial [Chlamydia psittaci 84-8471/1]
MDFEFLLLLQNYN